ncbi:MAG: discoidin domain-containing protein [Bacteroidales bacterium]|nr:discoidin domain-containing protein [Bacteroidales bacterium]
MISICALITRTKNILLVLFFVSFSFATKAQTTYSWIGADNADWTVSSNWDPERLTPASTDILQFNDGRTITITNVPTESIRRLLVINNTNINLESSGDKTLTIRGLAAIVNLLVESGSVLKIGSTGTNRLGITFNNVGGQLADISGEFIINPNDAFSNWYTTTYSTTITSVNNGGKITNNGGVITGAATRLQFLSGSEYLHNRDGGNIPTATWNANSLLNIVGITITSPTGINQTFGNVLWDNPNQAANINFALGTVTCNGDFTIVSTGTDTLVLGNSYRTIYVNGDFIINDGVINFNNTTSYYTRLYLAGNFIQNAGVFQRGKSTGIQTIYFQSAGIPKDYTKTGGTYKGDGIDVYANSNTILNLNNNFEIGTGRYFYVQNLAQVYLNAGFLGLGYFRNNSGGSVYLNINISSSSDIQNYGNFFLYDKIISGSGGFSNISTSSAYLYIGNSAGISLAGEASGNIQVSGIRTYGTAANYIYDGLVAQITGSGFVGARELSINNNNGVTLSANATVSTTLHLIDGLFELSDFDLTLSNVNNLTAYDGVPTVSNMVVSSGIGQLRKYFGTNSTIEFVFPVGDNIGTIEYTPARLSFFTNSAGYVGVNLTDGAHPTITSYSDFLSRYWSFSSTMTSYNYQLNYDYIDPDDVNGNVANILAVRNSTGVWTSYPSTAGTGNVEIATSPLTTITCPLNGSVFSGAGQEIICEENNGFLYQTFPTSALPTGWSVGYLQGTNNWKIQNTPGLSSASGGYYAVFDDWALGSGVTPNEAWIRSPEVYFCNLSSVYLSYYEYWYGVENTYGYVEISTDGGNTWIIVNTNSEIPVGDLTAPVKTIIDLTPYLSGYSSVIVRFRYKEVSAVGRYWYIDDINIFGGNDVGVSQLVTPEYLNCGETYTNSESVTIRVYNYSFDDVTDIDWTCDISGGFTGTYSGSIATIPANSYVDVTVATIDMSADDVYHFILNAEPQLPAIDGNLTNNTLKEGRRQLVQTYPYSEDFNISRAGWRQEGPDHQPPNTAIPNHHGREFAYGELPYLGGPEGEGNSWYIKATTQGSYDLIWLESPVFDFSTLNNPVLSMDLKYQLSTYYSYFHVEYSINDGANWYYIGSDADPYWYEGNTNWWYGNQATPVTDWTHVEHQLCKLSGEPCVKFRISGYAYYGISGTTDYRDRNYFAVDNFYISEGIPDDIQPVALTLTNSSTCGSFSNAETMQVLINNNTCRLLSNVPVSIQVDGGAVINEIVAGPIPGNASYLYTFSVTADLSTPGNHTIVATTNLPTDGDNSNDILTELRINNKILVDGLNPYEENFISGNNGWVSRINSNTEGSRHFRLGEVPYLNGAEGEGESWYVETKTHGNTTLIWAESPVFDLNGASDPVLFMDIKYSLSTYYSYFHVEYSINGGSNWTQLGTNADPSWYEGNTNWWYGNYPDEIDEWTTVQHSLCNIVSLDPSEKSCVKFRVYGYAYYGPQADNNYLMPQTDYSERDYFAFDNFKIIDSPEVGVFAITDPNSSASGCLYSQNQTVTISVRNYGCGEVYNAPVKCLVELPVGHPDYAFSPLLFSGTVPVVTANGTTSYAFPATFDMTPMGIYNFTSWTEMPGDISHDNDTARVSISVDFPKITTYPYVEDFNSNDGYWIAGGNNQPSGREFVWGTLPYLDGHEGEGNSWYVDVTTHGSYELIWVESPVFDFSDVSNPVLSMDLKYQLSTYYSYFQVRYSKDGGITWYQLGTNADPNWYQGNTNYWYGNYATPVTDWTNFERDLCELSGEPCVKFQIYGYAYYGISGTTDYRDRNYFAIDNFRIDGGTSDDAEPIAITLNNSGVCGSSSSNETIQVVVNNNLCRPLYDVPITLNVDGTDIATEVMPGPVPRFGSYLYTFTATADLSAIGNHTITVTTSLPTDMDNSNDSYSEIRINNSPIAVSPGNNYLEDFNSGNGGWVSRVNSNVDGTRHFRRGEVPYLNGADGQGDSWYVETTTNGNTTMIGVESPVFDLSGAVDPILKLDLKYELSTYYSYFHVEYSINGGTSWTQLGSSADPGWYEGSTNWWYGNYPNSVDSWTSYQRKLCELTGQSCVKFRIYGYAYYGPQQSNNTLTDQTDYSERNYFAMDNFQIIDAQDVGVTAIIDPDPNDVGCLYSDAQIVTVTVYNWSCTEAVDVPVNVDVTFNGTPLASFSGTVASIAPGSSVDYTFSGTFDMLPIGNYHFDAYTSLVPDANLDNDDTQMSIFVPFPRITTYPYVADFNGDNDYWLAGGDEPTLPDLDRGREFVWGNIPYLDGAEGEGESWYVDVTRHAEYYKIWAESPVFDFSAVTDPFLLMDIKYELSTYYSYFHVEYSLNGGNTWSQLGNNSDPDWYEGNTNWWYGNYPNEVNDWTTVFHNLCSFAGESCVKFRVLGYAYYGISGVTDYRDRNYFGFDNFRIIDGFQDASVSDFITPINNEAPCTFDETKEVTVRVKSASCHDLVNVPVYCDIEGPGGIIYNLSGTVNIPANTSVIYTFPTSVDLRSVGTYNFTAYTDLIPDDFPSNDTIHQSITTLDTLINTFPYYADFNNGTEYWRTGNNSATPTRNFVHGQFDYLNGNETNGDSWYVDVSTHGSYELLWVESPVFDFTEVENPILSFQIKYQLYNYYSYFHVEYSINGGTTWTQLGTDADPDWYAGNTNYWYNNQQNPFDDWTYVEHNLCNLKGQSCVKLRISGYAYYGVSGTTDYRSRNFFAFDNITITDTDLDAELVSVSGCYGTEYQLEVDIANRNNFCQLFDPCPFEGQTAIQFDNSNDRIELGAFPELSNFTAEYWILNPADGVGDYRMSVVAESNRFEIVKMNSGLLYFYIPAIGSWINTGRYLPVGDWSHVAVTSDGVELKVFLNGEEIYTRSGNYSIAASNWYLGARNNSSYPTNAALDEVRIWDYALSGDELRSNICNTLLGSEGGLVAYYQMEDGAGSSVLTDVTGNGHDGTLVNMDINTCWIGSTSAVDNNGVATDPNTITSIDVCYDIDGSLTCNTYPVNIEAGQFETIIIPNITIPNGLSLGNNICTGGTASASHTYSGSSPSRAFDGNISTSGWSNTYVMPCWLQYDLGAGNEASVNTYRIYCSSSETPGYSGNEIYNPGTWQFQGSNDGSNWDVLDNIYYGNLSMNTWQNFYFDNTVSYRYYRMYNTYGEASNGIHVTELQMYNIDPRPSSLVVWIQNPNGMIDEIPINDTIYARVDEFPHCNDNCVAAIELINATTSATSNDNATVNLFEDPDFSTTPCSGVTLENTSWYYFTTNCRGGEVSVTFDNIVCSPGGTGLQVAITRLDAEPACEPDNHTEVFCAYPGNENDIVWNPLDLLPETQYYITIDGVAGNTCDFQILLEGNVAFNPVDAMEGDRIIDGTGSFPDFQSAIDSLELFGISGPVHFNVADIAFDEQIQIGTICGASETNTITFETWCDDCGSAVLQYDSDIDENYTLKLYRTKYITFKNFDFRALGATNGRVLEISENTHHINFVDCEFNGISTALNTNDFALVYTKDTITNSGNINFNNCEFNNGSFALNITGKNSSQNIDSLYLINNVFKNQSAGGLWLQNISSPFILNNDFSTNSTRNDFRGISCITANTEFYLIGNIISSSSADGYGLFLDDVACSLGNEAQLINNMLAIGNSATSYGINIESSTGSSEYINVLFNSTNVLSPNGSGIRINTAEFLNIKNNNFISASAISYDVTSLINSIENFNNFLPDFVGKGANSITINPVYLSITNLHTENAGLQVGDNSTGITIDLDGETRQNPPYIGADEYLGSVIWTGNTSNDWNIVTNWLPNTYVSNATNVVIPTTPVGGYFPETNSNIDNLAETKNLTIQAGAHLYIAPNKYLTVWGNMNQNGDFVVQSDPTGTGSFINKGVINYGAGTTTVQSYISEAMWHYISSPIVDADAGLFFAPNFYWYDESLSDSWSMDNFTGGLMGWTNATGILNVMQGYITYQLEDTINYEGEFNDGNILYNLTYTDNTGTHGNAVFDGWNLVGNPYPSTLNWYDNDNISKINIDGAIYFYKDDGSGSYNNYSYFLPESNLNPYPSIVINRVSGCIPIGQSFFVRANAPGASIQVTNDSRIHNPTAFYKSPVAEPPTIRLSIDNELIEDEVVLRFIPNATNNFDGQLDAIKLVGYSDEVPYLFSISDDNLNLSIASCPNIEDNTIVPLGIKVGTSGQYSIISNQINLPDSTSAYLRDNYRNVSVKLSPENQYVFHSEPGVFRDRFVIWFNKLEQTIEANKTQEEQDVVIYSDLMKVFINTKEIPDNNTKISIFDVSGRLIEEHHPSLRYNIYDLYYVSEGMYTIIVYINDKIYTKKIILHN